MPIPVAFLKSTQLLIRIGNSDSPQQFIHPCMINTTRGIVFNSNLIDTLVPFCPPDEDLPGWIEREMDSLSATINGAGILDTKSLDIFWAWYRDGLSKPIHVELAVGLAAEGGYFFGNAMLSEFSIEGPGRREKVTFSSTMVSDGAWDFAAQSAGA